MEQTIYNFISNQSNGLYLNSKQTGLGKTYHTMKFIHQNYKKFKDEGRKIFFITPQLKNVEDAYKQLKEMFNNDDEFYENVIYIENVVNGVLTGMKNIDSYNTEYMNCKEFNDLKNACKSYNHAIATKDSSYINSMNEYIKEKEKAFRDYVTRDLDKYKSKDLKLKQIEKNNPFLLKLYPAILTNKYTIYFMSFDKFYYGNITLIEKSFKFINSTLIDNALVFIDEFDSTKDSIISNELEDKSINEIDTFHKIKNGFNRKAPNDAFKYNPTLKEIKDLSDKEKKELIKNKEKDLKERFEKAKEVTNSTYKQVHFDNLFKLITKDRDRKYLFDDQKFMTISGNNSQSSFIEYNDKLNENSIYFINNNKIDSFKKLHNDTDYFSSSLASIAGANKYFYATIFTLATNYMNWKNANKLIDEDERTISDCISSFLYPMGIYSTQLLNSILKYGESRSKKDTKRQFFETSIYEKGIRYYLLEDSNHSDFETIIKCYALNNTPESFLLDLCKKSNVVGLSATCFLLSNTGNYDLDYIKTKLGSNLFIPSLEDIERMNNADEEIILANKSKITINQLNTDDSSIDLKTLFKNENSYFKYKNQMERRSSIQSNENSISYYSNRFIKYINSIYNFVKSKNRVHLVICNNNFIDSNDESTIYDVTFIKNILATWKEDNIYTDDIEIISLISKDFDEKKEQYLNIVQNKRVILLTSYQSCSAGQNLNYKLKDNTNHDIDSLYLENPTNILVNINSFNKDSYSNEELLKYIYQIECLAEGNEISITQKNAYIKKAFLKTNGINRAIKEFSIYDTVSIKNHAIRLIIQAIGRICRTRNKCDDINIYIDSDIIKKYDLSIANDLKINKELQAVIDFQKENGQVITDNEVRKNIIRAQNNNEYVFNDINRVIKAPWNDEKMNGWKDLRSFIINNPCINDFDDENVKYKNLFFDSEDLIDKYYYSQENDFQTIKIDTAHFEKAQLLAINEITDIIAKNEITRKWFEKNNHPLSFEKSRYIILPIIYNNIYKGVIGEELGRCFFKEYLDINIEEINETSKFEKFDFTYNDIYIDFKFWNDNGQALDIEHIRNKLENVKGKKAIIINIYGNNNEPLHNNNNILSVSSIIDKNTNEINYKAINIIKEFMEV